MDHLQFLQHAIKHYGIDPANLTLENALQPNSWHGDLHFKISVDHKSYSARFIGRTRYQTDVLIQLTDDVLTEQIKFCDYLRDSGIPFMKHVVNRHGEAFTLVKNQEKEWRFVLFEWMDGGHLTHCTVSMARTFGAFARKVHNISSAFDTAVFPKKSHSEGHEHHYKLLCVHAALAQLAPSTNELLRSYFHEIEHHAAKARTDTYDYIVQTDLNPLNILWNEAEEIIGVVDFESITYTDRAEGVAWLVKWYSRTYGLGSHQMSPILAQSFLQGYGAEELLSPRDWERLPSLLWLTGCLNWNFTAKAIELLESNQDALLQEHLIKYFKRGETLLSLL